MISDFEKFTQIATKIHPGCQLLKYWQMEGGVSAQVTALEIQRGDNSIARLVVRRYGAIDLARNPNVAQHEFQLLKILHAAGIRVPQPYFFDDSGEIFPTAYLVIEFVEGVTDLNPANIHEHVAQLAEVLAQIHAVDDADLTFLPEKALGVEHLLQHPPDTLDDSMDEGRVREVLSAAWPMNSHHAPVILHGDFWPGNVLWKDGEISAVIDWEDGEFGDPLADYANARLEILLLFGPAEMTSFTQHYLAQKAIDLTHLPYWELVAALRTASQVSSWGFDAATEARIIETRREFVEQALQRIPRSI